MAGGGGCFGGCTSFCSCSLAGISTNSSFWKKSPPPGKGRRTEGKKRGGVNVGHAQSPPFLEARDKRKKKSASDSLSPIPTPPPSLSPNLSSSPSPTHSPSPNLLTPPSPSPHLLPSSPTPSSPSSLPPVGAPDIPLLREHLFNQGSLSPSAVHLLLAHFISIVSQEATILSLEQPFHIVGDLHGQFYDLLHILEETSGHTIGGNHRYLFLGDYVDRGPFSVEVCLYLFALKIKHPKDVFLLRGNHECQLLSKHFSFQKECVQKYGKVIFEKFLECFQHLPLAAVIQTSMGRFFCVHGGLSPSTLTLEAISEVEREREVPAEGALCDLLWSDPLGEDTAIDLREEEWEEWWGVEYERNPTRGCGYVFGYKALREFLDGNGFVSVVRGHEVQREGYAEHYFFKQGEREVEWREKWGGGREGENGEKEKTKVEKEIEGEQPIRIRRMRRSSTFSSGQGPNSIPLPPTTPSPPPPPSPLSEEEKRRRLLASKAPPFMFTIFSCPNYCDMYGNKGGVLTLHDTKYEVKSFSAQPHPYVLPTLDNALSYTFPYVMENLLQFFLGVTKYLVKATLDVEEEGGEEGEREGKGEEALEGALEKKVQNLSLFMKLAQAVVNDNQQQVKEQNTITKISDPYVRFDRMRTANMKSESLPGSTVHKSLNRCISSHL